MSLYPTLSESELLEWINTVNNNCFKDVEEMKQSFNVLATIDGLLFWRINDDCGNFKCSENINITPTHTSGTILNKLDVWTTINDDWFIKNVKIDEVSEDIRDTIKEMVE